MIEENLIYFQTEQGYEDSIDDINPDSLTFVAQRGYEKLVTQDTTFYFIPSNGSKGQTLKSDGSGGFMWEDLNSVKLHDNVNNLGTSFQTYIIEMGTPDENRSVDFVFNGNFVKGQELTVYVTKDKAKDYGYTLNLPESNFFSLSGVYSFDLVDDIWWKLRFIYDGSRTLVELTQVNFEADVNKRLSKVEGIENFFQKGELEGSVNANNGTLENRTNYGFAVGRYNKDNRASGDISNFGNGSSLFTVGNGVGSNETARHSAFDVRDNGAIYYPDLDSEGEFYEKTLVCLQEVIKGLQQQITELKARVDELEKQGEEPEEQEEEDLLETE